MRMVSTPSGPESGVDFLQPQETADEQAGAGEQRERQSQFRHGQRAAKPRRSAAWGAVGCLPGGPGGWRSGRNGTRGAKPNKTPVAQTETSIAKDKA